MWCSSCTHAPVHDTGTIKKKKILSRSPCSLPSVYPRISRTTMPYRFLSIKNYQNRAPVQKWSYIKHPCAGNRNCLHSIIPLGDNLLIHMYASISLFVSPAYCTASTVQRQFNMYICMYKDYSEFKEAG